MPDSRWLWVASCIHGGAKGQDVGTLAQYLDWANDMRADIALIGDIIDTGMCFGTKHIGSVWDNTSSPSDQIDAAVELFRPYRKRIKLVMTGNHEMRVEQLTSISPAKTIAQRLGVRYVRASAVLRWNRYNIFMSHGHSGGLMTDFNKVMNGHEDLDAVVLGHVHELAYIPVRREVYRDSGRNKMGFGRSRVVHLLRAGSFLSDAPYSKFALHRGTAIGSAILHVNRKGELKAYAGTP